MRPFFTVSSGPDASHWQHTITVHAAYKDALAAYDRIGGTWSAVIIRCDDQRYTPGTRTLKRQNQHNHGHAAAWCDEMNRTLPERIKASCS